MNIRANLKRVTGENAFPRPVKETFARTSCLKNIQFTEQNND